MSRTRVTRYNWRPRRRGATVSMSRSVLQCLGFCVVAMAGCGTSAPGAAPVEPMTDSGAENASCPAGFDPFEVGDSQRGEQRLVEATLVNAEPATAAKFRNVWTLALRAGGHPSPARVTRLETFMPVHGHPGQPAPSASTGDEPGQLGMELFFTMRGPWEVRISVEGESPSGGVFSDRFVFDVCVRE